MNLTDELQKYGVSSQNVRTFDSSDESDLLDYLDLVKRQGRTGPLPDGVAESQGRPLLFFVDESRLASPPSGQHLQALRRSLACRGDWSYLARILPGEIKVVPIGLDNHMPEWKVYRDDTSEAETFFSKLALGLYDGPGEPSSPDQISKLMFDLLKQGADALAGKLGRSDVLSLVGRALFFRFLQDRHVIGQEHASAIAPRARNLKACFDTAESAAATCKWLDRTFNGDFLHLSRGGGVNFFDEIAKKTKGNVFRVLGAILSGDQAVGSGQYQGRFDWGDFEFAHIPIGLLSQVYEKFVWTWADREAKETSVHYTPRNIAATLVDEAFDKLPSAHEACVLDPACGAGVFLVFAFRRIYRERWKVMKSRPDTKAIRTILENQLKGIDISDSALKLSALSLYLTAIELDPEPVPAEKLRFNNLQGRVLFNLRQATDPEEGFAVGSLGKDPDVRFDGKFDLILCNPPWTSMPKNERGRQLAAEFTETSRNVIRGIGGDSLADAYQNPDNAPDLPFLWKATRWCRPGGRIAMALPGRILFKQEAVPVEARNTLFRLLEVTGIINGSNLSDTNVWPEMQQPFMLMFARNGRPRPSHVVRFITPYYDAGLNRRGKVRIDSKSSEPIEPGTAGEVPWIWKALAIGTSLDLDIVRKLNRSGGRPLKSYWEDDLNLKSGNGYQVKPNQKQCDASHLHGLPDLNSTKLFDFVVKSKRLEKFQLATARSPRERDLYRAPLVLVRGFPGTDRTKGWALLSHVDVAFNESFHGFSASGHPEGETLVRYVHLLAHSLLWMHYALLRSPKLGTERRQFYKSDLDEFPIVPLDELSDKQKRELTLLSRRLETADRSALSEIDTFFAGLYGLNAVDVEVIRDTLSVCLPYKESRERACRRPEGRQRVAFCQRLESLLRPFFKVINRLPEVKLLEPDGDVDFQRPFDVLTIGVRGQQVLTQGDATVRKVLRMASDVGATRTVQEKGCGLVIGILNQYRYWTPSRARLLAADILRQHTAAFEEA